MHISKNSKGIIPYFYLLFLNCKSVCKEHNDANCNLEQIEEDLQYEGDDVYEIELKDGLGDDQVSPLMQKCRDISSPMENLHKQIQFTSSSESSNNNENNGMAPCEVNREGSDGRINALIFTSAKPYPNNKSKTTMPVQVKSNSDISGLADLKDDECNRSTNYDRTDMNFVISNPKLDIGDSKMFGNAEHLLEKTVGLGMIIGRRVSQSAANFGGSTSDITSDEQKVDRSSLLSHRTSSLQQSLYHTQITEIL